MKCAAAAGIAFAAAGCSPTPVGGSGTPTTSSTSSSDALAPGTPNVAHPLDTTAFQKAPCSVLTAAQLKQFNIGATGKAQDDPLGPHCGWADNFGPSKIGLSVIFATAGSGLSDIYSQKAQYVAFQPLSDIDGYPAVIAMTDDARPQGDCKVSIGVSNQLFISVEGVIQTGANGAPDATQPCPRIQAIATAMVTTMKGGS